MRIYLSRPHMSGREQDHVAAAFACNFVAPVGPQLDEFEANMAAYLGEGGADQLFCVALSSGSAALHLGLRLAGVDEGDEVWVSSMTFAGGVFPISYLGATPSFFDLDPQSWTIDGDLVEEALHGAARANRLPKAIVPTDLYGQSVDLDRLEGIADTYDVALVVDSAESLGGEYRGGRRCGTGGSSSILSFNGNKIITTSGGGMLVTRSARLAADARFLATQARDDAPHYEHSTIGYNYRMSNVSAAIGLGQLEVLNDRVAARRRIQAHYREALARPGVSFMPEPDGYRSTRWLTTVLFDPDVLGVDREDVRTTLLGARIESRPLWKPMHLQPVFKGAPYVGSGFDEELFAQGLCLPSGSDLTEAEQDEVITRILDLLDGATPR